MFFRNDTAPAGLWRFIKNDGYLDTLCFVAAVVAMFSCARKIQTMTRPKVPCGRFSHGSKLQPATWYMVHCIPERKEHDLRRSYYSSCHPIPAALNCRSPYDLAGGCLRPCNDRNRHLDNPSWIRNLQIDILKTPRQGGSSRPRACANICILANALDADMDATDNDHAADISRFWR